MRSKIYQFPILIFTFLLLAACQAQHTRDSIYSSSHYTVHGKKYYILRSSKHYQATGLATWYGKEFHRHRTFSGERYNMYQMTAAHKTLPLHTRVEVINLRNGKNVVVKINDRGPFVKGRIIDVSYAAAKKLGMLGYGPIPVRIKAVS